LSLPPIEPPKDERSLAQVGRDLVFGDNKPTKAEIATFLAKAVSEGPDLEEFLAELLSELCGARACEKLDQRYVLEELEAMEERDAD
jgi:hypothetical protein